MTKGRKHDELWVLFILVLFIYWGCSGTSWIWSQNISYWTDGIATPRVTRRVWTIPSWFMSKNIYVLFIHVLAGDPFPKRNETELFVKLEFLFQEPSIMTLWLPFYYRLFGNEIIFGRGSAGGRSHELWCPLTFTWHNDTCWNCYLNLCCTRELILTTQHKFHVGGLSETTTTAATTLNPLSTATHGARRVKVNARPCLQWYYLYCTTAPEEEEDKNVRTTVIHDTRIIYNSRT